MARRHVIVAGHYLAAQAGMKVLEAGGNAVNAAVAAGIALSVVESEMVSFAGVAPIILYVAETQEVVTISGLGLAAGGVLRVLPPAPRRRPAASSWAAPPTTSSITGTPR